MLVQRQATRWAVIDSGKVKKFASEKAMKDFIVQRLAPLGLKRNRIYFSESKETI